MDIRCDLRGRLRLICSPMQNLRSRGTECQPPTDWNSEREVGPSEELNVEFGCPDVITDDNGEDSMGL